MELERDVEGQVCKWAEKWGFMAIKFTPRGDRGWPDRIFIAPDGTHVWIEFKRRGKAPRKLQDYRLRKLREQNVIAHWFDDAGEAIELLKLYL